MLAKIRTLALFLALVAAVVPSFMYITDVHRDWLWMHIGVNIFAYITVAITTIRTTLEVAGREKHKHATPVGLADKPLLETWWTAVRLSWRWHVLAAFGRLGLAHALAQELHRIVPFSGEFNGILAPFYTGTFYHDETIRPLWVTVAISIVVVLVFCLAETGLLTATTLAVKTFIQGFFQRITQVVALRLVLILLGIMLSLFVKDLIYKRYEGTPWYWQWILHPEEEISRQHWEFDANVAEPIRTFYRGVFSLFDNGTMLAAEIMLPMPITRYDMELGCVCVNNESYPPLSLHEPNYGQRAWIASHLLSSSIGLSLYAALTGFCLFIAHRRQAHLPLAAH